MFDSLPVIIVTAKTKAAAAEMISEMIDSDATEEARPAGHESADRVWRLVNKYYSALVRVHARALHDAPRAHAGPVGAHVLLLEPAALSAERAERRLARAAWLGPAAPVNVLACDAPAVPDHLLDVCARHRLEPAALRAPPAPPEPGPFPEPRGLEAVRAALHVHAWPGLRREPPTEGEDERQEEELDEGAFLRALEALGGAAARGAGLQGAARRAAAERLVLAFAAAIGHPLDDLEPEQDAELDQLGL